MFREPTVFWHKKKDEKKDEKKGEMKDEKKDEMKLKRGRGRPRSEDVSLHDCCSMFREPTEFWHKKKVSKEPKKKVSKESKKKVSKKPKKIVSKIYTLENDDLFGVMDMIKAAEFGNPTTTDCFALD